MSAERCTGQVFRYTKSNFMLQRILVKLSPYQIGVHVLTARQRNSSRGRVHERAAEFSRKGDGHNLPESFTHQ